jgi:hypothetical protein
MIDSFNMLRPSDCLQFVSVSLQLETVLQMKYREIVAAATEFKPRSPTPEIPRSRSGSRSRPPGSGDSDGPPDSKRSRTVRFHPSPLKHSFGPDVESSRGEGEEDRHQPVDSNSREMQDQQSTIFETPSLVFKNELYDQREESTREPTIPSSPPTIFSIPPPPSRQESVVTDIPKESMQSYRKTSKITFGIWMNEFLSNQETVEN